MSAQTMRAISQDAVGGPEVLHEVTVPIPSPGVGEILVRVRAAGVNPTDWKHRSIARRFLPEPPFTLGWDVAGEVAGVGLGVTVVSVGDEVFGMLPYPRGHGAYAEYVVGPARGFVAKPVSIDFVQAAALPLVSLTAWQALVDTANLVAGERVLIHAAAGGVGHIAVQIAKARGAYVIGTASAKNHDFVRSLGADEVIDYRDEAALAAVRECDVVLDSQGSEHAIRSLGNLRDGGRLVSLSPDAGAADLRQAADKQGKVAAVMLVEADQGGMRAIADLAADGALTAAIFQTFELADAAEAHTVGERGHNVGKIVLTVA